MKQPSINSPLIRGFIVSLIFSAFLWGVHPDIQREYNRGDLIRQEILQEMAKLTPTPMPTIPQLTSPTIENINDHIDVSFIKELEGTRLKGYVPMQKGVPIGKSGVTVASGFDIGQRNEGDLLALGLPRPLIAKLKPYLGLKKWNAVNKLREVPLVLTQKEVDTINEIVFVKEVRGIIQEVGESTWLSLGRSLRTVLASVQFQYGSARTKTPNFFKQVLSLDVHSVIKHLDNFGDGYAARRKKEANYLRISSNLNNGKATT